jgi:hypothetical protein
MKLVKLTLVVSTLALLSGCVAIPVDSGYYDSPGPVYVAPAPAYYGPSIGIGIYRGYRGHRHGYRGYSRGYRGHGHGNRGYSRAYRGHGHGDRRR